MAKLITYKVATKELTVSDLFESENNATILRLDFTDAGVTSWTKYVRLVGSNNQKVHHEFVGSAGDDIVDYSIPAGLLTAGTLSIMPEAYTNTAEDHMVFGIIRRKVEKILPSGNDDITFEVDTITLIQGRISDLEAWQLLTEPIVNDVINKMDLDGSNSNVDVLKFNAATLASLTNIGEVRFNPDTKRLEVKVSNDITIEIGSELVHTMRNAEASTITNGTVVYVSGGLGSNTLCKRATVTDGDIAQKTVGVATEDLTVNESGGVCTEGVVHGINTNAFPEGSYLYLSTNGTLTATEPTAPTPKIFVGVVLRQHLTQGELLVKVRPVPRMARLSDVFTSSIADGHAYIWNAANARFENEAIYTKVEVDGLLAEKLDEVSAQTYIDGYIDDRLTIKSSTAESISSQLPPELNITIEEDGMSAHLKVPAGHSPTKEELGLGNVDNTSDVNKPISTAQQTKFDSIDTTLDEIFTINVAVNLFNKDSTDIVTGKFLGSTGNEVVSAGAMYTHKMPVVYNADYSYFVPYSLYGYSAAYNVNFYNEAGQWIAKISSTPEAGNVNIAHFKSTNVNAKYCIVNGGSLVMSTTMFVKSDVYPQTYLPYVVEGKFINDDVIIPSILKGKTAVYVGDSICYGSGSSGGYAKIISDLYGVTYTNYGANGATIRYESESTMCIARKIAEMDANADFCILEGGVNDNIRTDWVLDPTKFGEIGDSFYYDDVLVDTTFCGAFESMLKQAIAKYGTNRVAYVAVHKMTDTFDSRYTSDSKYYKALECCAKWGVTVIDLNINTPAFGWFQDSSGEHYVADLYALRQKYVPDGWHPNLLGYQTYYVPKIVEWMKEALN